MINEAQQTSQHCLQLTAYLIHVINAGWRAQVAQGSGDCPRHHCQEAGSQSMDFLRSMSEPQWALKTTTNTVRKVISCLCNINIQRLLVRLDILILCYRFTVAGFILHFIV